LISINGKGEYNDLVGLVLNGFGKAPEDYEKAGYTVEQVIEKYNRAKQFIANDGNINKVFKKCDN